MYLVSIKKPQTSKQKTKPKQTTKKQTKELILVSFFPFEFVTFRLQNTWISPNNRKSLVMGKKNALYMQSWEVILSLFKLTVQSKNCYSSCIDSNIWF